jgi:hypothetical protein
VECSITLTAAAGTTTGRRLATTPRPIAGTAVKTTGTGIATGTAITIGIDITIAVTIDAMTATTRGEVGDTTSTASITATTTGAAVTETVIEG